MKRIILFIYALIYLSLPLLANDRLSGGLFAGGSFFEGSSNLSDTGIYGGRMGWKLSEKLEGEGSLFLGSSDVNNLNVDVDLTGYAAEVLLDLNSDAVRPFLTAGLGLLDVDRDDGQSATNTLLILGWGIRKQIYSNYLIRLDFKGGLNIDDGQSDMGLLTFGLSYGTLSGEAKDEDGDGVRNKKDECPGTPSQAIVNKKGCAVDSDQDGVADYKDLCPHTPTHAPVNANGCPDTDEDGLADNLDQCPDQPETVNKFEDEDGCPDQKPIPEKTWILNDIQFASGAADIKDATIPSLIEAYEILRDNPTVRVEIQGHTDSQGNEKYNQSLSLRRAESIRKFMVGQGIDASRLDVKGYGESQPIDTNETKEGRAKNRRIEFKVLSR